MLTAEVPVFLFMVFVQFAATLVLTRGDGPYTRLGTATLAYLFATNTGVSAILLLGAAGVQSQAATQLLFALDEPAAYIIGAFVAARRPGRVRTSIAIVLLSLASLKLYWTQPWLPVPSWPPLPLPVWLFVAFHGRDGFFFLALIALCVALARGPRADRWVLLAFAPRLLYFWADLVAAGDFTNAALCVFQGTCNPITDYATASVIIRIVGTPIALVAIALSLRGGNAPPLTIALPVLLMGPFLAIAGRSGEPGPTQLISNLITLGLIRPLFVLQAYDPHTIRPAIGRSAAAAASALIVYSVLVSIIGYGPAPSILAGLLAGAVAFGILDQRNGSLVDAPNHPDSGPHAHARGRPRTVGEHPDSHQERRAGDTSPPESGPPTPTDARPIWIRVALQLAGSSTHERLTPAPPAWSQQRLSADLGISIQRVSEFPRALNQSAAQKLDLHLPGWRAAWPQGQPELVTRHRGAVSGSPGALTYYRLTEWGERLADALAATSAPDPGADSGRNPDPI